jgi:GalNAc5-diNAcBac-PP-undecaprenol beta-1,3-glucosyltransferase
MIPKISIIMATYNRAHFIVETLQSIQNQSFINWECLIIDDGGNDNTFEVIEPILKSDSRFTFQKRADDYQKGLSGTRNCGLDLAKGEYVIFFDDDDVVHPENLKISLEAFDDISIDFCHYQKQPFKEIVPVIEPAFFEIKQRLNKEDLFKVVNQEIGLASCTVLWKKKCFDVIRFNENLHYAEEWECYIRILSECYTGVIINTVLYYNRKHLDSNTGEYCMNNPKRKKSHSRAILLVIQNLKEKGLLSTNLKRYFVTLSKDFGEYDLYNSILMAMDLQIFETLKWQVYNYTYRLRLPFYKIKKYFKKSKQ